MRDVSVTERVETAEPLREPAPGPLWKWVKLAPSPVVAPLSAAIDCNTILRD